MSEQAGYGHAGTDRPAVAPSPEAPVLDPWRAFAYLVSGVGLYGGLGWLLDRWLGTGFIVAIGAVVGAGLGLWMTFAWLRHVRSTETHPQQRHEQQGEI